MSKKYTWVKPGSIDRKIPEVGSDVTNLVEKLQEGVVKTLLKEGFITATVESGKKNKRGK